MFEVNDYVERTIRKLIHLTKAERVKWKKTGENSYSYSTSNATVTMSKNMFVGSPVFTMLDSEGEEIERIDRPRIGLSSGVEIEMLWDAIMSQESASQDAVKRFLNDLDSL